jgi:hypothetical protein
MIEFITASHNEKILHDNLLKSLAFLYVRPLVQRNYTNVAKAYNKIPTDCLTVYVHHDVVLYDDFMTDLLNQIERVEEKDSNWAVLGCAGVKLVKGKTEHHECTRDFKGYILDRGKKWGAPYNLPAQVDTLDELILITKGDFIFDENLSQDFYGADICMQAKAQGRKSYAINAYVEHNSGRPTGGRTNSYYESLIYFREKWKDYLPIATTTMIVK